MFSARTQQALFLVLHTLVELSVALLMVFARMPAPYDEVFSAAHSVVRGFAGGGAAAVGVIGVLTLLSFIPRRVGLAFCGSYQLFIAFNEGIHEGMLFPGGLEEAGSHILFGIGPHLALGLWGVGLALFASSSRSTSVPVVVEPEDERLAVVHRWASKFGYYDGRIDLSDDDLSTFAMPDATLTAHAPLWGVREGEETPAPAADVRRGLRRLLRWFRVERHDMQLATHPDGHQICLFFVVRAFLPVLPFPVTSTPLAYVVSMTRTPEGLRIETIDEWPASSARQAHHVLVGDCGWPDSTTFRPHVAFGAVS